MEHDDEPLRIPVTDVFDLHTVRPQEVKEVVEAYLKEANRLGLKALRIIHGRGIGVHVKSCAPCWPELLLSSPSMTLPPKQAAGEPPS